MAKVGRPKKYRTAKALEKGVRAYFDEISYSEQVEKEFKLMKQDEKLQAEVPVLDEYGHPIISRAFVFAANGAPATRLCWVEAPSIEGLCLKLGISRNTWNEYEKRPEFADTTARARGRIEEFLIQRLDSGKGTSGAAFRLQCMHGWSTKQAENTEPVKVLLESGMEGYAK
jgi:hypothetical protein